MSEINQGSTNTLTLWDTFKAFIRESIIAFASAKKRLRDSNFILLEQMVKDSLLLYARNPTDESYQAFTTAELKLGTSHSEQFEMY